LPHFSQTERVFLSKRRIPLNARSKLANFLPPLRSTSPSLPRDNAASKFENRINYVHDVAVVRHNNESAAPVPACAAQQSHYVSCVLVVQISGRLVRENKNWVVRQGSSNGYALLFTTAQLSRPVRASIDKADSIEEFERTVAIHSPIWDHWKQDIFKSG